MELQIDVDEDSSKKEEEQKKKEEEDKKWDNKQLTTLSVCIEI